MEADMAIKETGLGGPAEASEALTPMKVKDGALRGSYLGIGDRKWAIERLRRWCDLAERHLSTGMIDQMAWRIGMYLSAEALHKGDEEGALRWRREWQAELMEDKRADRQVQ
jgi:hypothetical protein